MKRWLMGLRLVLAFALGSSGTYATNAELISLNLKGMDIADVMEMLARKHRVNILLGDNVTGEISLNLFDVSRDQAIRAIAEAAGYAVERRRGSYFILPPDTVGRLTNGVTRAERFHLNYADPDAVAELLESHISQFGSVTSLPERNLVIVADQPAFLSRIERLVRYADEIPQQVLIEAQILEVTLTDEDTYGIDWSKLFQSDGGNGSFGTRGLFGGGSSGNAGFLFELVTPNVDVQLSALQQEGRIRTLSTPTLVALDNEEASVVIGDRRGYQVTTTINQVTTESIEFLESGVILRVTPNVDPTGNIMMDIHPEVSTGAVDANGIPSQTTTEVTTSLLVPDGKTVFIGGLIKHTQSQSYQRVPVLGRIPGIKALFRSKERSNVNTETVVLITPRLQNRAEAANDEGLAQSLHSVEKVERELEKAQESIRQRVLIEEDSLITDPLRVEPVIPLTESEADATTFAIESGQASAAAAPAVEQFSLPYAVQVMQMTSEPGLKAFLKDNRLEHLQYLPVTTDTGTSYALILGFYATRAEALVAATQLPLPLADAEPWIRRTEEINVAPDGQAIRNTPSVARANQQTLTGGDTAPGERF